MADERVQERNIAAKGGVSIGGAPVAYTAILAALVAVMALIPASIVVGGMGGGWPLHDVIHSVVGMLLGPIAGPIASAVGTVVGGVIAPYTNLGPWGFLLGAGNAFAVAMVLMPGRSRWYVPWGIVAALHVVYYFQTAAYGIPLGLWISNVFTVQVGLVLMAIPQVRNWAIDRIRTGGVSVQTFLAFYVVCLFGSVSGAQMLWVVGFATNPWPAEVWTVLIFVIFVERTAFAAVGALIATGVVQALRRSAIAKAEMAGY
jgi:hypothetical protein